MGNVFPGYMGLADISGVGQVRFSDASISAKQTVDAPDLVNGDWDHDAYNYGKIEVGGSIAGPVTETFMSGSGGGAGLWNWGVCRHGACGILNAEDVTLYYYCNGGGSEYRSRAFSGMLVNSLGFSCAAGDVAQFTMDIMGSSAAPWGSSNPPPKTDAEKLLTWDKVGIVITDGGDGDAPTSSLELAYSNFDFTISNNLNPVYSLGQKDLFPFEIVPGMRTITGTLSIYNTPQADGFNTYDLYDAKNPCTISFTIGSIVLDMKVRFHRIEPSLNPNVVVSSLGFSGLTHQSGPAWED